METTRSNARTVRHLGVSAVEEVLLGFIRDSSDSHAKARWLRRAMMLPCTCDDHVVEERLQRAVVDCFAVLQSLLSDTSEDNALLLSPQYIACAALFLHLQSLVAKDSVSFWLPMRMQEQSARSTNSRSMLKRYVRRFLSFPKSARI